MKSTIEFEINMKKIKLTKDKYALVDDEDFGWLNQWRWYAGAVNKGKNFYASRRLAKKEGGRIISMHRLIMNFPKNKMIDHVNGNSLDNRRINLRICSRAENARNQNCIKLKGVCFDKKRNKWASQIMYDRKHIFLGYYDNKKIAARIYDYAAIKYFKKFACCNYPNDILSDKQYYKLTFRDKSSKYIGVYKDKKRNTWCSSIHLKINSKNITKYLGDFKSEISAAKFRDNYIIKNNIKNRKLNFKKDKKNE